MKKILSIVLMTFALSVYGQEAHIDTLTQFLPEGYVILEKTFGDLNKDGVDDCVLVIKGTDSNNIIDDENRGKLDRNRRGIIVLINTYEKYELSVANYACFSSGQEDGSIYFPPDLSINIKNGNLLVYYGHGRYGFWQYTFRKQNSDFELIGYDQSSNRGPVTNSVKSINFLTRKKQVKVNTYQNEMEEVFKETWTTIEVKRLIKLSEIKDFDELDMTVY